MYHLSPLMVTFVVSVAFVSVLPQMALLPQIALVALRRDTVCNVGSNTAAGEAADVLVRHHGGIVQCGPDITIPCTDSKDVVPACVNGSCHYPPLCWSKEKTLLPSSSNELLPDRELMPASSEAAELQHR